MYLTVKQQVKHLSKEDYSSLRELCHTAKNLANEAIYNIRQYYFDRKEYLRYEENYALLKESSNYKLLNSNMAQQILREVDGMFKSFFGLIRLAQKGQYSAPSRIPHYLPKDGYMTLVIGFVRIKGNKLVLPYSRTYRKTHNPIEIKIPPILLDKEIKEIRIIPKAKARFFEIQYTYEAEGIQRNLDKTNALALDFGVNNLVTAVSSDGKSFIIDGKRLKSINQWFNKENARLQSIHAKQNADDKKSTNRQKAMARSRNNKVNDYISKAAKIIINHCIENNIGNLVAGYSENFQRSSMGAVNNQTFVNIPYGKLMEKLCYLCKLNGITFVEQEESYTSKASFFDRDEVPVLNKGQTIKEVFSGKRIHRGMYRTKNGKLVNADVNGALNILKKSNVVSLETLYSRGDVDTPVRIRVA